MYKNIALELKDLYELSQVLINSKLYRDNIIVVNELDEETFKTVFQDISLRNKNINKDEKEIDFSVADVIDEFNVAVNGVNFRYKKVEEATMETEENKK